MKDARTAFNQSQGQGYLSGSSPVKWINSRFFCDS